MSLVVALCGGRRASDGLHVSVRSSHVRMRCFCCAGVVVVVVVVVSVLSRSHRRRHHVRCRRPTEEVRRAAAYRVQRHSHAALAYHQGDRRLHGAGQGQRPVPVWHRQEGEPVHGEGRLRYIVGWRREAVLHCRQKGGCAIL